MSGCGRVHLVPFLSVEQKGCIRLRVSCTIFVGGRPGLKTRRVWLIGNALGGGEVECEAVARG